MPSLILRLESLAQPNVATAPAAETDAAPREPDDQRPPASAETAAAADNHDAPEPVAPEPPEPEPAAAAPRRGGRLVELAASERLSTATPLSRWSAAVAAAHDACFVVDGNGVVISISVAAVELLGCGDTAVIGRHILDVINLVDLETGAPHPEYAPRITPLVVLQGPGLGRSLMRVRHGNGTTVTLDSASVPIHDVSAHLLGSVTFLEPIPSR